MESSLKAKCISEGILEQADIDKVDSKNILEKLIEDSYIKYGKDN